MGPGLNKEESERVFIIPCFLTVGGMGSAVRTSLLWWTVPGTFLHELLLSGCLVRCQQEER